MNAYWRAANYLSVGEIYLSDNPLLRELMATFRYNLGLASVRPAYGRFTYWEKMEYWALVWGTLTYEEMRRDHPLDIHTTL